MVHTGDVDHYRHKSGLFTPMVTKGVEDTERWFYQLMDATREAGVYEKTNFFLISDHGQMEIVRSVKPNVLFAENGLMDIDENGNMTDWKAYCHSTGMSAQIRLKDPTDKEVWQKTYDLLKKMEYEGIYGISKVYTAEEIDELEHLNGEFSFVVETDGYSSFSEDWKRPIVAPLDITDYRFGRATHGHMPDKGPQPVFFAVGPDIKEGVYLERRPTVDEAPTYAKILGAEMPWADGVAIDEILVNGDK
jgi:predicted AlkP superfamily pyrophosphatase or phosphodiesterase